MFVVSVRAAITCSLIRCSRHVFCCSSASIPHGSSASNKHMLIGSCANSQQFFAFSAVNICFVAPVRAANICSMVHMVIGSGANSHHFVAPVQSACVWLLQCEQPTYAQWFRCEQPASVHTTVHACVREKMNVTTSICSTFKK